MATKKKLLQAAAGTAAASGGAGGLNVEQVFSTYLYEGNGSAQVIDNGINLGQSYGSGGVKFDGVDDYMSVPASTDFEFGTGDFTVEAWVNTDYSDYFNIWQNSPVTGSAGPSSYFIGVGTDGSVEFSLHAGGGGFSTSAGAVSQVTWAHVAIVRNSGTTYIYVDGVQQTSSAFFSGYNFNVSSVHTIGYRVTPNYASGYMADLRVVKGTAVYTSNFTAPTSPLTAITNTVLLTCQGDGPFVDNSSSSHTVTVDGAKASTFGPFDAADAGEGGLVWCKKRNDSTSHGLFDTERGATKQLDSSVTTAQETQNGGLTSFNSNGFTVGNSNVVNGGEQVSWTFRKAPKFFTCLTYTGTGVARTISHDLGSVPGCIMVKRTDTANDWIVYHRGIANAEQKYIYLNQTAAAADFDFWSDTAPTSTEFSVNSYAAVNASGGTYVAYLFAHNDGDGDFGPTGDQDIIKCGSYTGNGSSTGPEIDLGFEPQWIMIKRTDTSIADSWIIHDTMRGIVSGGNDPYLLASSSGAENSIGIIDVTPTGFKLTSTYGGWNASGGTYIYIAIRRGPMAVPTDATDVFGVHSNESSSTDPYHDVGFTSDMMLTKDRNNNTSYNQWFLTDRLRGNRWLETNSTNTESGGSAFGNWDNHRGSGTNSMSVVSDTGWLWQRRPNYFDVVAYTGNGTAGRTVSHNLGVAPEMMWVKNRASASNWLVYHKDLGATKYLVLSSTAASATASSVWNDTAPTDSVFTLGSAYAVNESGSGLIAYLFASVDGVSKVGSINHTSGVDTNVDCGFQNGARFVLWKQTDAANSWGIVDVERGLVSGNDALLLLNSTAAETSSYDLIDPLSSGFVFTGAFGTGSYIFYAIA